MDFTRNSNDFFTDKVRFLFSHLVDTTCRESVEKLSKKEEAEVV